MTCPLPHMMRPATEADLGFLRDPWVQEMRHSPWSRGVPDDVYFPEMKAFVGRVLRRSYTLIACNPEDPTHVFGFVTFERPNVVHWIYVKRAYQRVGLGQALLDAAKLAGGKLIATQASSACFDKFDRKTHERTHVGYFSDERTLKFSYHPFLHSHPRNQENAIATSQASAGL